jgi:hypothetical protein
MVCKKLKKCKKRFPFLFNDFLLILTKLQNLIEYRTYFTEVVKDRAKSRKTEQSRECSNVQLFYFFFNIHVAVIVVFQYNPNIRLS